MRNSNLQKKSRELFLASSLFIILLSFINMLQAQIPDFTWAKRAGGIGEDLGKGIATDRSGNSFIVGYFYDSATFGAITLTSAGNSDIFIAKYDASGNVLWAKRAGGTDYDRGFSITTDNSGNCIVNGDFRGSTTFGTFTLTSAGGNDIFIAKYDGSGNVLWAKRAGGTSYDRGYSITTDESGNSIMTGYFSGSANFGTTILTSAGSYDIFITKYDPSGNVLWAKQAGGTDNDGGYSIVTDRVSNSFITGYFNGSATFGTTTLTSTGNNDIFTAKYDAQGNVLWAKQAGGTDTDYGSSIAIDGAGNSIITGEFQGLANFGAVTLTSTGNSDIFIVKYDASGNILWAKRGGGTASDHGYSLVTDGAGNSILTGDFEGSATFGTTILTSDGAGDIFIAKYDASGNVLWAKRAGGVDYDSGTGIVSDGSGNTMVTGYFAYSATFGTITLTSYGGDKDIFVAKLTEPVSGWKVPITVSSSGTNFPLAFGGAPNATEGYDAGLDIATAPPGMTYYAYFELAQFPNYLSTDIRGWIAPYSTNIDWTLKIVNASGKTSIISWDPTSLPPEGSFTMEGAVSPVNMRTQSSVTFSGDKVLTIKYRAGQEIITVAAPNGGENWQVGTTQNITWTSSGTSGDVKIELSRNGGTTWETLFASTPDDHSQSWRVTGSASTNCKIKITDVDGSPSDMSDNPFTIILEAAWKVPMTLTDGSITLTRTFGGDANGTDGFDSGLDIATAPPGMTYYAYFELTQFPNYLDTDIRAWVSPYQTAIDWTLKIVNATGKTSTITWNPTSLPSQGTFTLEGVTTPVNMQTQSSVTFTGDKTLTIKYRAVVVSTIKVISPNGGDNWPIDVPQTITWSSINISGNVKIEITTNNGISWSAITPGISNTGSYSWAPTATYVSTNCLIKISSVANPAIFDQSDAVFTISGKAVNLWIDTDLTGPMGGTINVPIHCSDVTNLGIYGAGITITYNASVLEATNSDIAGTMLAASGWGAPTDAIISGQIKMAMAGTTPLSGSGILVKIKFKILGSPGVTSTLHFAYAVLNEGVPAVHTTDGLFTVVSQYFDIKGRLGYYFNPTIAVKDALVQLTGAATKSDTSVANGNYEFLDLTSGNYSVTLQKNNDTKNAITSFDASLVLRYTVGSITLTPYQKIAGDVSGNGEVSSYDASFILRYAVGSVTQFPVGADWTFVPHDFAIDQTNWSKSPRQRSYTPLNADQPNQDFLGILYGDVSGNWPGSSVTGSSGMVRFNIINIQHTRDGKWLKTIEIKFIDATYSGNFNLLFKNPNLKFTSSLLVNPTNHLLLETAKLSEAIHFAFASAEPLTNQGIKINLLFEEINPVIPNMSDFEFADVIVDDKLASITGIQDKSNNQFPDDWQLCQNHPNPFNYETSITYQVSEPDHIKIEIYNTLGQCLYTLVDEDKSPGTYTTIWNGKDDLGQSVGSGIYIYRMKTLDFSAIKKMLLIQ